MMKHTKIKVSDSEAINFINHSREFMIWSFDHRSAVFNDANLTLMVIKDMYAEAHNVRADRISIEHDIPRVNYRTIDKSSDVPVTARAKELVKEIVPSM